MANYSANVIFDSHITKMTYTLDGETTTVTTSPFEIFNALDIQTANVIVELEDGYILDTITNGTKTSNISFTANLALDSTSGGSGPNTITVTSKKITENLEINITQNGTTTLATKGTKNAVDIDINVNIPTYITVASESDLPTTADEGTIAIVESE